MSTPIVPILIAGPAFIQWKGAVFYSKGNVTVTPKRTTFQIETARYGALEEREDAFTFEVKFTPVGDNTYSGFLAPYGDVLPGSLVHAIAKVASIDTATNIVTFDSITRFRNGSPVRFATLGSAPGGLTAGGQYFFRTIGNTTGTLHDTEAHALANTNIVDITSAGSGTHRIVEEDYLLVTGFDGEQYKFHNAAVVGVPAFTWSAKATLFGEVTFECFRAFNTAATNAAAFYTRSTDVSITDTSFNLDYIVTKAATLFWGDIAPWDTVAVRDGGVQISFTHTLEAWGDDTGGVISRKITEVGAQLTASPLGITAEDVLAKLVAQGSGAGRGRRISSSDDLAVVHDDVPFILYSAILLDPGALNWDAKTERVGKLTWKAQRTVSGGSAGGIYGFA